MDKILSLPFPDFKLLEYIDPDQFDANNDVIKNKINEIVQFIDDLSNIVEGSSGAEQIGSAPINGVAGTNVYEQLKSVRTLIDQLVLGQIADGSITNIKLNDNIKIGSLANALTNDKSSVVNVINEVITNLNTLGAKVGNLTTLTTTEKSNIVDALNELDGHIGIVTNLPTQNKTNTVAAINEIKQNIDTHVLDNSAHGINTKLPISGGTIEAYTEKEFANAAAAGTVTLDLSAQNVFELTLTDNITIALSNVPATGKACSFSIIIHQAATAKTVTFPASFKWMGGNIPVLSAVSKTHIIFGTTVDGGATVYATAATNF